MVSVLNYELIERQTCTPAFSDFPSHTHTFFCTVLHLHSYLLLEVASVCSGWVLDLMVLLWFSLVLIIQIFSPVLLHVSGFHPLIQL